MTARPTPAGFYDDLWRQGTDRENARRWSFQQALAERAVGWLAARPGDVVVEVGPGPGRETRLLAAAGARVLAVDVSQAALVACRRAAAGRTHPVRARAEALPLADGSVDAVFAQTVLMHLDLPAAAAEWARVLRPAGRVVLLEPLAHHPLVAIYRLLLSSYRATRPRYVTLAAIARACPGLVLERHQEHYLLAVLALAIPGAPGRAARRVLERIDRALLRLPGLGRLAWMTLVELRRRGPAGQDRGERGR